MENTEKIKLFLALAAIMLVTSILVMLIDFKTKRDILAAANGVHDDLEKVKALDFSKSQRGTYDPVRSAGIPDLGIPFVPVDYAPEMEAQVGAPTGDGPGPVSEGSGLELPKRNGRNANPTVPPGGKRVGSRTNPSLPKEGD